jgi:hypothetical protein
VGDAVILHYDGAWTEVDPGLNVATGLAVWGSAPDDVLVLFAGYSGAISWDGTDWTHHWTPRGNRLLAGDIHGPAGGPAWLAASEPYGPPLRWDGTALTQEASLNADLHTVWASSTTDVWMAGQNTVQLWDGTAWAAHPTLDRGFFRDAWGASDGTRWLVGDNGTVVTADAASHVVHAGEPDAEYRYISEMWGTSTRVWGFGAAYVGYWDGAAWQKHAFEPPGEIHDVWGVGDTVWLLVYEGSGSSLWTWDGTDWTRTETFARVRRAVYGTGPDDLWVAGENAAEHWDGTSWTQHVLPGGDVWAMHGSGTDNIWAVGGWGARHRWDGATWHAEHTDAGQDWLTAVWVRGVGDVWDGGSDAQLHHYDGTAWTDHDSGSWQWVQDLHEADGMLRMTSDSSGGVGYIAHWDGAAWVSEAVDEPTGFGSIWGSSALGWWVGGAHLHVLHRAP